MFAAPTGRKPAFLFDRPDDAKATMREPVALRIARVDEETVNRIVHDPDSWYCFSAEILLSKAIVAAPRSPLRILEFVVEEI